WAVNDPIDTGSTPEKRTRPITSFATAGSGRAMPTSSASPRAIMAERAPTPSPLEALAVAVLATDGVEQVELEAPIGAMQVAGADVYIITPSGDTLRTVQHGEAGETLQADRALANTRAREYGALVLPGGAASVRA